MKPKLLPLVFFALATASANEISFKKQTLTAEFVAEGCAIGDFNRDGHMDLTAGCYIWLGPDFSRRRNFTPARENASGPTKTPYDPAKGYSDFFLIYAFDFNGDGWEDILVYGIPGESALLFLNPQGKDALWEQHAIFDIADGESPDLKDLNGDGKPELLVHSSDANKPKEAKGKGGGQLGYAELDWANPLGKAHFGPSPPSRLRMMRNISGTPTGMGRGT